MESNFLPCPLSQANMSVTQIVNNDPYDVQTEEFRSNIIRMLQNESDADVIIECEGKEFQVHKLILVASSDYFKKMFESSFQESSTNRIKFPTITKETMKIIIDFIYLSRIPLPTDAISLMHIFKGAHYLEIKALIDHCSKKLVECITDNNYPEIWKFVDLYQNRVLTIGILDFLVRNIKNVMISNQFLLLTEKNIMFLIKKINENKINVTDYMIECILKWVKYQQTREKHIEKLLTAFERLDLSRKYIDCLINNEPLITQNASILLKLFRYQMKKTEDSNVTSLKCKRLFFQQGKMGFQISPEKPLPFKITNGTTWITHNEYIYVIGAEINNKDTNVFPNCCPSSEKGSTNIIKYDPINNIFTDLTPMPHPVFNAKAVIHSNKLYIIGKESSTNSKSYIQSTYLDNIGNTPYPSNVRWVSRSPHSLHWTVNETTEDLSKIEYFFIGKQLNDIFCYTKSD